MSNTFQDKVSLFVKSLLLSNKNKTALTKEIIRYVLQLKGQQRTTVLRKLAFSLGCLDEVAHFKNQYLDVSHYIHKRLWKDIRDDVDTRDVRFCKKYLTKEELNQFVSMSYTGVDSSSFDMDKWLKEKIKHLKSKTYKLRFIKEYDPSFDADDFVQELACEAVRVVTTYERCKSVSNPKESLQDKLEKYIEGALNNKIRSFIEYHTSGSRRRAMSTNDKLYKKLKATKKQLNVVKSRHKTYYEGVVNTRLKTLDWSKGYIDFGLLIKKFSGAVVTAFEGIRKITLSQLRKVLLDNQPKSDDVLTYERKVEAVQNDIKKTEGDYYARTYTLEPGVELGVEDLDASIANIPDHNQNLWLEKLKVKDHRDAEYLQLVLDNADDNTEKDFVAWANTNHSSRSLEKFQNRYQLAQKFVIQKYKGWRNKLRESIEIREMFAI